MKSSFGKKETRLPKADVDFFFLKLVGFLDFAGSRGQRVREILFEAVAGCVHGTI